MSDSAAFTTQAFDFLRELTENNNRAWFEVNKERYERAIRAPALAMIHALAPAFAKISKHYVPDERKTGGSLMKVHRDVRFSADKTPYKTNIGIHVRHDVGKDAPGFYLHVSVDEDCFVGVGMWKPEATVLAAVRARIVDKPAAWKKARDDRQFRAAYDIVGDSLKRPPRGFEPDHPLIEDLRRTDHIASAKIGLRDLTGKGATARVAERFAAARPYARFLTEALNMPF